jgi:predicted transcriptional regulator
MVDILPSAMRYYRLLNELKHKDLAPILGVGRTSVVNYEKQANLKITAQKARKLAEFLGVTVADLQSEVKRAKHKANEVSDFKYKITEGNYVGLHTDAWESFQKTLERSQKALIKITNTNSVLTNSNSKLVNTVEELVKNLPKSSRD